jgi:hypothetical protein
VIDPARVQAELERMRDPLEWWRHYDERTLAVDAIYADAMRWLLRGGSLSTREAEEALAAGRKESERRLERIAERGRRDTTEREAA